MSLSKSKALQLARTCISDDVVSIEQSVIASLWGGMGQIYRISTKAHRRGKADDDFVVKYMKPRISSTHPSVGDKRKLDSYVVEAEFYERYSQELMGKKGVGLAKCLHVERDGTETIIICLSLLENAPYDNYFENTIEWLATFHAATWQRKSIGLQPIGTYWHLDTRQDEWERMSNRGWEGRLKLAARAIHEWLQDTTPIQSWVHGDAKDVNVMWDGEKIAMCDFQYVGRGCPLKDLCYFLCSNGVADDDTRYLDLYHEKLSNKLKDINAPAPTREELDAALELAYCDYQRFMCGWGEWGSDIRQRVQTTLDKIDNGKNLGSEDAYRIAVSEAFRQ